MNVLSLFDGMSCGRIALERAGIPVTSYYASEIDKHAMKVAKSNYPDTVHIGNVVDVKVSQLPVVIDLLIGGSPCQGFSKSGKGLNFDDPRSKLFFEYLRILKECREINPDVKFMLENVNLHVKYHKPQRDGTMERLIPCYSWSECGQHVMHLAGIAETERRAVDNWKSVGEVSHDIITKLGDLCRETE